MNTEDIMNRLNVLDLKVRRTYHMLQYAFKISFDAKEIKTIKKKKRFNEGKIILRTLPTHSDNYINSRSFDYQARIRWNKLGKADHNIREKKLFDSHILKNIKIIHALVKN